MMLKLKRIIGETIENIKTEKVLFFTTFITLTVIFLILEFFWVYTINLKKVNQFVKSNMQIRLYIEKGVTEDGIKELEKELLAYNEIRSIKYVSREIALKQMSNSLGVELDFGDNPLPDTIVLTLAEDIDFESVTEKLAIEPGIEEVETRSEFIQSLSKLAKGLNKILYYMYVIVAIPIFILIFNLVHYSILYRKESIEIMSFVGATGWYIRLPFILEGIINVIFATFVSGIVFIPLYDLFRKGIELVIPVINIASTYEILISTILAVFCFGVAITTIASYMSTKRYLKIYGE